MTEALAQMNTTTDILVLAAALLAALCYLYFKLWKYFKSCNVLKTLVFLEQLWLNRRLADWI